MPVCGRWRAASFLGALLALGGAGSAGARSDDFDRDLPVILAVQFEGNVAFGDDDLRAQMSLEFPSLMHPLRPRPRFRPTAFAKELRRIDAFYRLQGFAGASTHLDTVQVEPGTRAVRLRVHLREGPRTRIRELRFLPQQVFSLDELRRICPLGVGDPYPFNAAALGRATRALRLAFLSRGYLAAGVRDSVVLSQDSTSALLLYRMHPGRQFAVRAVSIAGNDLTRPGLIRRELRIQTGQVYNYTRIQESQQNLYATSLFRSVAIREEDPDSVAATVDLAVRVVERRMAFVEGSVGFGRRDNFEARASAAWGHRNLLGRGMGLEARSTLAYNIEQGGDRYYAEQRVHYAQPHMLGTDIRFSPQVAYVIDQRQRDVSLRSWQVDAEASRRTGRYTNVAAAATATFTTTTVERERITDDLLQTRALSTSISRNNSDDIFNPRRGDVRTLTLQRAGFAGDNYFSRASGLYTRYVQLGSNVVALGVRAGWVESYGKSRGSAAADIGIRGVPFEYLFQAGGSSTVRGFDSNSLGVAIAVRRRDPMAERDTTLIIPVRVGTVLLLGNLELRRRAPWPLGRLNMDLALFVDAGNVWENLEAFRKARFAPRFDSQYVDVADLRYGYGFGLRYRTPVGPIRADLAFPLKRFGQRVLHLGLGHPF